MKQCIHCKKYRSEEEFGYASTARDKLQSWCRQCKREFAATPSERERRRRYKKSEAGKVANKKYWHGEKGKALSTSTRKAYREKYPERYKAHNAVTIAINRGRMPSASTKICACGEKADLYHHHNGYSKEHHLDVIPVCFKCHMELTWQ